MSTLHIRAEALNDLLDAAARLIDFSGLRHCWNDEKKAEWDQYVRLKNDLKAQMQDMGYCLSCRSIGCSGDCESS